MVNHCIVLHLVATHGVRSLQRAALSSPHTAQVGLKVSLTRFPEPRWVP